MIDESVLERAMELGIPWEKALDILTRGGVAGASPQEQWRYLQENAIGETGVPRAGLTTLSWNQYSASGRAQMRSATALPPGFSPYEDPSQQWMPGFVSFPRTGEQFPLRQTVEATPWPVSGGNIYTGLEDPGQFVKRFKQMASRYEQVFLSGKPIQRAPWRTGPASDVPERGQSLHTAILFGPALPEGMSLIEQGLGTAANLRYVREEVPAGFSPELAAPGAEWGYREPVELFRGHTGIAASDWERQRLLDIAFTPGGENEPGIVQALLRRDIPLTRGLKLQTHYGKDYLVGADVTGWIGESGFDLVKSGGMRDVYGGAFAALSSMTPAQFEQITGQPFPPTWQSAANQLVDIFTGSKEAMGARMYNIPQVLSQEQLAQFRKAGRVVGQPTPLEGDRYQATIQWPGLELDMFTMLTRAGTYEHRRPLVAGHTLEHFQRYAPDVYEQFMREGVGSRRPYEAVAQAHLSTRGYSAAPNRVTMMGNAPLGEVMAEAQRAAMEATGAESVETIPIGALQSALLEAVPREWGYLGFQAGGRTYYFPNPADIPRAQGAVDWEEKSAYRWHVASLLQAAAAGGGTGEPLEKALAAQEELTSSHEFWRHLKGVTPRSLWGGTGAGSYANRPEEAYLPTRVAARAAGLKPDTMAYHEFAERFESGEELPLALWHEPATVGETVATLRGIGKWVGQHPDPALRQSETPILSEQMAEAMGADFDGDDYYIAALHGVTLPEARKLRERIVQMAATDPSARAARQAQKVTEAPRSTAEVAQRMQARSVMSLEEARERFAERTRLSPQMGIGFNILEELQMAAPTEAARGAASTLGAMMYQGGQEYQKWEAAVARLAELRNSWKPRFGRSPAAYLGEAANLALDLPLEAEQRAALFAPPGMEQQALGAIEAGDVGALGRMMEEMPGGAVAWGEQSALGRLLLGRISARQVAEGGEGISPELTRIGQALRSVSETGRMGSAKTLVARLLAEQARAGLTGGAPTNLLQGFDPGLVSQVERMWAGLRFGGGAPTGAAPSGAGYTPEEYATDAEGLPVMPGYTREQRALIAARGGPRPTEAGGPGGRAPGGTAPPGGYIPGQGISPGWEGLVNYQGGAAPTVNIQWPSVKVGDFQRAIGEMEENLSNWSQNIKAASEGTVSFTKEQIQTTNRMVSLRNTIERGAGPGVSEAEQARFDAEWLGRGQRLMQQPGWQTISAAEQQLGQQWWGERMGGGGAPGGISGFLQQFAPRGRGMYAGDLGQLAWGLFNVQRLWRYTGGQVAGAGMEYAQYTAQQQQAMAALGIGGGYTGPAADIMAGQATMERAKLGFGRAAWETWGWLPRTLGQVDATMQPGALQRGAAFGAPIAGGLIGLQLGANILNRMGMATAGGALGLAGQATAVAAAPVVGGYIGGQIASWLMPERYPNALEGMFGGARGWTQAWGLPMALAGRGFQALGWEQGAQAVGNYAGWTTRAVDWAQRLVLGEQQEQAPAQTRFETEVNRMSQEIGVTQQAATQAISSYAQATGRTPEMWTDTDREQAASFARLAPSVQQQVVSGAGQYAVAGGFQYGTAGYAGAIGAYLGLGPTARYQAQQVSGILAPIVERGRMAGVEMGFDVGMPLQQAGLISRMAGGDRYAWSRAARQGMAPAWMQSVDELGLAIGTRSLMPLQQAGMAMAAQQGTQWLGFGEGLPAALYSTEGGYVPTSAGWQRIGVGGTRGVQDWQRAEVRAYQDIQSQQQWAQFAAAGQYQQASWGIEDLQRAGNIAYQQTQFGFQGEQLALSDRQFRERMALNRAQAGPTQEWAEEDRYRQYIRGMTRLGWAETDLTTQHIRRGVQFGWEAADLARGYTRQGVQYGWQEQAMQTQYQRAQQQFAWQGQDISRQWARGTTAYQWQIADLAESRAVNQLQYGWSMEDYDESIRFATGRQRERLIRQRERATVMQGVQTGRFETQEERMEERREWEREDHRTTLERFAERRRQMEEDHETELEQFEQRREWSEEDFAKAQERLEQRRTWEDEDFDTQKDRIETQRKWLEEDYNREEERHEQQVSWQEERWQLQERHHDEDLELAQRRLDAARSHFEEETKLEDRAIQLRREYWEEDRKRQEEALAAAEEHRDILREIEDWQIEIARRQEDFNASMGEMWAENGPILTALRNFANNLNELQGLLAIQP